MRRVAAGRPTGFLGFARSFRGAAAQRGPLAAGGGASIAEAGAAPPAHRAAAEAAAQAWKLHGFGAWVGAAGARTGRTGAALPGAAWSASPHGAPRRRVGRA